MKSDSEKLNDLMDLIRKNRSSLHDAYKALRSDMFASSEQEAWLRSRKTALDALYEQALQVITN
jgi:hypothetical protein